MRVLAGTKIWGHETKETANTTVDNLNNGKLDGIVMTEKVGGCGHNLVGASQMIFIGSLYSHSYEEQAICDSSLQLC